MAKKVLITGGAGFIGSHLADRLLSDGYDVRILDCLSPQVHGPHSTPPAYLNRAVELVVGDVRDPSVVRDVLRGIDGVFHLAAAVGVGQSMYELTHYTATNNLGTATLLEALIERPVERLVVASSMSIYGEGLSQTADGRKVAGVARSPAQLRRGDWELHGDSGESLTPVPTPESKPPDLASVYALSKYDQEKLCLLVGRAYGIPTTALRFFNVYGPRQALSNPYTGVLAIFAARLLNHRRPLVFEDGEQRRDFVHVRDVADCALAAYESPLAEGMVFNVGSGRSVTVNEVALKLASLLGQTQLLPEVTHKCRVGDIRHCFADITRAREVLNYAPRIDLDTGMADLVRWLSGQPAADRVDEAHRALEIRGLTA
jgi:dTDP-L-rhamnose 4-epimerase